MQWRVHLGAEDQEADAALVAALPDKWTAEHRGRGVCYLYAKLRYSPDVWSGIPSLSAVVDGLRLFDPRDGATRWSENNALAIRTYLTQPWGLAAGADEIDAAAFIAAANACDETVTIDDEGATQRRYWLGGVVELDDTPMAIMEQLCGSCAGTLVYTGGRYRFFAGVFRPPVLMITADDLRAPVKVRAAHPGDERCNRVRGTFPNAAAGYQAGEFPAVTNPLYEAEYGGEIARDITLALTPDAILAQRLARVVLERARQGSSPATSACCGPPSWSRCGSRCRGSAGRARRSCRSTGSSGRTASI